jgi:transcriptional regulator with XRE-family HTH domain
MRDFAPFFRAILAKKVLTQAQAGELLGWSQHTVSYYCRQKKLPRPHVLEHMAKCLGVTVAELTGQSPVTGPRSPSVVRDAPHIYMPDPGAAALADLRRRYQKSDAVARGIIASDVARLFGQAHGKTVLTWLEHRADTSPGKR